MNPYVDRYSIGVIMWELETGQIPFKNESSEQMYKLLVEDKLRPKIPPNT